MIGGRTTWAALAGTILLALGAATSGQAQTPGEDALFVHAAPKGGRDMPGRRPRAPCRCGRPWRS